MQYTMLTDQDQIAIHEGLLKNYESDHVRQVMQIRTLEQTGNNPDQLEQLKKQVSDLETVCDLHRQELDKLKK